MIIEGLLSFFQQVYQVMFGWINLPDMPAVVTETVDWFLDMVFDNIGILGFFVRWSTVVVLVPIALIVFNIDKIYDLIMWVLKKLPFLSIE